MLYKAEPERAMDSLRAVSKHLIPLTFPFPKSRIEDEEDIAILKKVEEDVDGYSLILHFNKANYGKYYLESFQVLGKHSPFLPFHLVVKLAQRMLGGHYLSFVEFYQENRKIYCWSVCVDKEGKPIPSPIEDETESCEFEGFEYKYMRPNQLNFY